MGSIGTVPSLILAEYWTSYSVIRLVMLAEYWTNNRAIRLFNFSFFGISILRTSAQGNHYVTMKASIRELQSIGRVIEQPDCFILVFGISGLRTSAQGNHYVTMKASTRDIYSTYFKRAIKRYLEVSYMFLKLQKNSNKIPFRRFYRISLSTSTDNA